MPDSNAYLFPWPPEVQEDARRAFADAMESFGTVNPHITELVKAVSEARGALQYHGSQDLFERLGPVVDFLWFVQNRITDQGLRVAAEAQSAVYRRREEAEDA